MVVCAAWMASYTVTSLVGTQVKGMLIIHVVRQPHLNYLGVCSRPEGLENEESG